MDKKTRDFLITEAVEDIKLSFDYSHALEDFLRELDYLRRSGTMPSSNGTYAYLVVLPFKKWYWFSTFPEGIVLDISVEEIVRHRVIIKQKEKT